MGWAPLGLYVVLVACFGAFVLHLYRGREAGASGVGWLAALRVSALAIVVLLVFDPAMPAVVSDLAPGRRWTLTDGSASMTAREGEESAWVRALQESGADGGSEEVLLFGAEPRALTLSDHDDPPFGSSRLTAALERAAESGVRTVTVLSDLRIEDSGEVREAAEQLGLTLRPRDLGGDIRSAGIASFRLDTPLELDTPVRGVVEIFGVGAAGDSVALEIRSEDRLVHARNLALPDDGRVTRLELELPPPQGDGAIRYSARVALAGDDFLDDDEWISYADVRGVEGNLVLISLDPDWEFRFLLPVLERATGLPPRGYLRVGPDRFLRMGAETDGESDAVEVIQRAAAAAEILVVQGAAEPPAWLAEALAVSARSLVLARGVGLGSVLDGSLGEPRPGEWYVSQPIPTSPIAGELSGLDFSGLPPLSGLLSPPVVSEGDVPLSLQLRGSGAAMPAMLLLSDGEGQRRVLVLTSGYWRWALRAGTGRDAYERLWSGVAGWLLADEALTRVPGVRPIERVVTDRGMVAWAAPSFPGQPIHVRISAHGETVTDSSLVVPEGGRFQTAGLDPGEYAYVSGPADGSVEWAGRFDVSRWTADLIHPRDTTLARAGAGAETVASRASPERPLRTHPLPYLVVVGLLCAEWIGRRRRGLR